MVTLESVTKQMKDDKTQPVNCAQHVYTFIFMHLSHAFIQSDLQCIQAIHVLSVYVCSLGIEPTTFCAANAMLYH